MKSQLAALCLSLRDLAAPLGRHFGSPEALEFLSHRYGWTTVLDEPAFERARAAVPLLPLLDQFQRDADAFEQSTDGDIDALLAAATALAEAIAAFEISSLDGLPPPMDTAEFWTSVGEHLLDDLLEEYLRIHHPGIFLILRLWAAIRYEPTVPAGAFRRPYTRIRLDRAQLVAMVKGPLAALQRAYRWNDRTQPFDHAGALSAIAAALNAVGVPAQPITPAVQRRPAPPQHPTHRIAEEAAGLRAVVARGLTRLEDPLFQAGFDVYAARTGSQNSPSGLLVRPILRGASETTIPLGDLAARWGVSAELADAVGIVLLPGTVDIVGGAPAIGTFVEIAGARDEPWYPLGNAQTAHLEIRGFVIGLSVGGTVNDPDVVLRAAAASPGGLAACRIVVPLDDSDGFVKEAIGRDSLTLDINAEVRWSHKTGLSFNGRPTVDIDLPVDVRLGPVTLRDATLSLVTGPEAGGGDNVAVQAAVDVHGALGPVAFVVEQIGFTLGFAPGGGGDLDLGGLGVSFGFKAPHGIGLAIDAGPAQGGGLVRYDAATGRYGGALAIELSEIAVRAVALLDTRLPGGQRGFSLLVMLSARFSPGIQLGFGITLTGVGGLVGVNRRIDVDALRERFAAGTAARILNPPDPDRALATQLTELGAVFPPAQGVVVVGPTVQLQWAGLVTIDAGIFIELPGPTKVVLLGTARATIANPLARGPLLQLRADFIGVVDLDKRTIAFDAVLVDSRLLEVFAITGGMSLRADFGDDDPYLLLTVGGFHPDFTPPRLAFPATLTRLAMSSGSPGDRLYLRFEGYFAITPNTMQFGAAVEVSAKLGPLRIKGFLGFDALVRFEPFFFSIDFEARLRVQVKGRNLAGVKVTGTISGPGPVTFRGRACISILFFDICGSATFELGSKAPPQVSPAPTAFEVIADELRKPGNLRAAAGDALVALRELPAGAVPVLPPTGLIWQQRRAPLGLLLERFEGIPLRRAETVTATSGHSGGEEREWFAPGSYAELTDAEAVNRRTFERLPAGLRIGTGDDVASDGVDHTVEVEEIIIPAPPTPPGRRPGTTLPPWLLDAIDVREARPDRRVSAPRFQVAEETWTVRTRTGRTLAESVNEARAHQLARTSAGAVATPSGDTVALPHL